MLPAALKLRRPADFAATVKGGRRIGTRHLIVHVLAPTGAERSSRAGFVVSTKVGNSVVRHRVTRRLRPLVRAELAHLPAGTDVVIRALPAAAEASSAELAVDLQRALRRGSDR